MHADRVELSWDTAKSKWLVKIESGQEVIRRYCAVAKDADEPTLRSAVQKIVQDEGYESDLQQLSIHY